MSKPVSLRKVTAETVVDICSLKVASEQANSVAPNALSIAQAHFDDKRVVSSEQHLMRR